MSDLADTLGRVLKKKYDAQLLLGDDDCAPTDYISTGVAGIDAIIGAPGFACGRLSTVVGAPGSGKSTLTYALTAECQKRGGTTLILETEDAILNDRLRTVGIESRERIYIVQPKSVEETLNIIDEAIENLRAAEPDGLLLIIWDSVAATPCELELKEDAGKATMGAHAKLLSQGLRKLTRVISKYRVCLVFVNQYREKIGGMAFAENKTMLADSPIRFSSSLILEVARKGNIKGEKGEPGPRGIEMIVRVKKNKLAAPYREAVVDFDFAHGFDKGGSWLELACDLGVAKAYNGGWYSLPGYEGKQATADAKSTLLADVDLQDAIRAKLAAA